VKSVILLISAKYKMYQSYDRTGPKPDDISQETHEAALELIPKLSGMYGTSQSVQEMYQTVDGKVFDEAARILNYNEPFVIRDIISGPTEVGHLNLPHQSKILDIGCGTGFVGRLLGQVGYKNITGIDASEHHIKTATDSGDYLKTICMFLGRGATEFPEELKEQFDIVVAGGIWVKNHMPKEGMDDAHSALKPGGYFISSMRRSYYTAGEACGYKDKIDELISDGKFAVVKEVRFLRGVPGCDGIFATQECVAFALQKLA
jgi:2-polyprenyl-3-methyl-5-hydroxy-6-metoxy-1,4-benzoquinol methylase